MPRYCPTCNRSEAEVKFYGNFCEICAGEKLSEDLKSSVELERCKECGRIRVKGRFIGENRSNLEEGIQQQFKKNHVHVVSYDAKEALARISIDGPEGKLTIDKTIKLKYIKKLCDRCYKIKCEYYEALFQLRGDKSRIEKVIRHAKALFERNNEFISKMESKDGGIDLYLSNKKLASEFVAYYKLYPKMSYTLAGVKFGKKQYKNIYAIHL
jgi:NMD protein affecting ribosome stability and mRNA decay